MPLSIGRNIAWNNQNSTKMTIEQNYWTVTEAYFLISLWWTLSIYVKVVSHKEVLDRMPRFFSKTIGVSGVLAVLMLRFVLYHPKLFKSNDVRDTHPLPFCTINSREAKHAKILWYFLLIPWLSTTWTSTILPTYCAFLKIWICSSPMRIVSIPLLLLSGHSYISFSFNLSRFSQEKQEFTKFHQLPRKIMEFYERRCKQGKPFKIILPEFYNS